MEKDDKRVWDIFDIKIDYVCLKVIEIGIGVKEYDISGMMI